MESEVSPIKPFCMSCITQMPFITFCKLCPKWESVKDRYAKLAKENAELQKKLLLATILIERQIMNGGGRNVSLPSDAYHLSAR